MTIIDGRMEAAKIITELTGEVKLLSEVPKLAIILVGNNSASEVYVSAKLAKAKEIGVEAELIKFAHDVSEEELLQRIDDLNNDASVNAILVQLPLPNNINQSKVQFRIDPKKDVDAFNPYNVGMLYSGFAPYFIAPTPMGVFHLINSVCPNIEGKNVVVVGKSNIVGKPLASLLMNGHATVTICHSLTKDLADIMRKADIIVTATGAAEFFTREYFSQGQIVIDVGISRKDSGGLVGDVDFESAKDIVSHITPVPGGVGPMTIAYLMYNVVEASRMQSQ